MKKCYNIPLFIQLGIFFITILYLSLPAGYAKTYKSWYFSNSRESWETGGTINPKPYPIQYRDDGWPGIIYADCTGSDPYFVSPGFSLSAKSYHTVVIKIDAHGGSSHEMRVYWKRNGDSGFSESRSKALHYSSSTGKNFRTVSIDVGKNSSWNGTIKQIRIDTSRSSCYSKVRFHIDSITIEGIPVKPTKPNLSSPSYNANYYKGDKISFKWSNNGYSCSNWMKIFDSSGRVVFEKQYPNGITSQSWTAPTNKTGNLRWEVALQVDGLWSSWASRPFYVNDIPKPSLSSPSNGTSFNFGSNISFKWNNNGLSGSNWFKLYGPSGVIMEKMYPGGSNSLNWNSGNNKSGQYRWMVAFQKNNQWSRWSERNFSINKPQPPPPPNQTSPGNNASYFIGDNIGLRWSNNGYNGPIWLKVYNSNNNAIINKTFSKGTTSYNWTSNNQNEGSYRWELAMQVNDVWSKWTSRNFKLNKPQLTIPAANIKVGDRVSLKCNIGKQGAGRNVGFFVDTKNEDPVGHPAKADNNGLAIITLLAKDNWTPEASFLCRDEQRKTTSNWIKKSINPQTVSISISKSVINVGDEIVATCSAGSNASGHKIGFFVDQNEPKPVGHPAVADGSGNAHLKLSSNSKWIPKASICCHDEDTKSVSIWKDIKVIKVDPQIQTSKLSAPQGSSIKLTGTGYSLNNTINIELTDAKGTKTSKSISASNDGSFEYMWISSLNANTGYYHFKAIDNKSGKTSEIISVIIWSKQNPLLDEPHGLLARTVDDPDVYWVKYNKKWYITGSTENKDQIFFRLGYQLSDIIWYENGSLDDIKQGKDIFKNNDNFCYRSTDPEENAVYIIVNNESHPFYDWPTFAGQGFSKTDIFWAKPEGIKFIQELFPYKKSPMIRIEPDVLKFK